MRAGLLLLLPALAACGQSAEEKRAADDADVAAVEAAQKRMPPLEPVRPQVLLEGDIARIDAVGPGCILRIGEGLSPPVLITVGSFGWLKLEDEIVKMAGDSGSERGPAQTWTHYTGRQATLRIGFEDGEIQPTGAATEGRAAILTMRDSYGRVIYRGRGIQTCSD